MEIDEKLLRENIAKALYIKVYGARTGDRPTWESEYELIREIYRQEVSEIIENSRKTS